MSGTNHNAADGWQGPGPVFVLVRPQMGENIGAAARGMWNFGLDRLRLTNPRDGWPNPRAVAMSSGAAQVIDNVNVYETTDEAIADLNYIYATTARSRDLTKKVFTPQDAMADAHARIARGERVGVLFGPERAGLENADVVPASALISVPVNPSFASLNLAQCVLLMAYEWSRSSQAALPHPDSKAPPAKAHEVAMLLQKLDTRLEAAGYFWPDQKVASKRENLRNLISRLELTDADVRTLHGIFNSLADGSPARK
ncbi:RNA methyltransferase [Algicella marina]|uniref:RNA methyltransferase n=1 Tax=Algicella marina TaxID=2683284 RepID=A0A6P1T0A1_9RHOB|nr:RNA methyltransferase [Algicella marina]QHQ34866.1 RNA methyltransferase [Algicella marina]